MFLQSVDMLSELSRREQAANIKPDLDLDVYMKVRTIFLAALCHKQNIKLVFRNIFLASLLLSLSLFIYLQKIMCFCFVISILRYFYVVDKV